MAELLSNKNAKYDVEKEREVRKWIEKVLNITLPGGEGLDALHATLKDGVILCKLINIVQPESVTKINESKMAFKMMENIANFLSGCEAHGVAKDDLFQTADLYENQNMAQVVEGIYALGRKAWNQSVVDGIGPKEN